MKFTFLSKSSLSRVLALSGFFVVFSFLFVSFTTSASAATIEWDGGGSDDNWDTSANWSPDGAPTESDSVVVSGTVSNKNIDINTTVDVSSFTVTNTYSGTITVTNTQPGITVSTTDFDVDSSNAEVDFNTSTVDLQDFRIKSGTVSSTQNNLNIEGILDITGGTFDHNNGTTTFDTYTGPLTSTTIKTNGESFNNVVFDDQDPLNTQGWKFKDPVNVSGTFKIVDGAPDLNGQNLKFESSNNKFENQDIFGLNGGETLTNFTPDTDSGTTTFQGATLTQTYTIDSSIDAFHNLKFNDVQDQDDTWNLSTDISVSGKLLINQGILSSNNNNITVSSSWENTGGSSATFNEGNDKVIFDGTGSDTNNIQEPGSFSKLTLDSAANDTWQINSGDDLSVTSTFNLDGGTLDLTTGATSTFANYSQSGGTFKGGSGNVDINAGSSFTPGGNFTAPSGKLELAPQTVDFSSLSSFNNNGGTIELDNTSNKQTLIPAGSTSFANFTVSSTGQTTEIATNNLGVTGTLKISKGTLDVATNNIDTTVSGSWKNTGGSFNEGNQKVTFDGTSGGPYDINEPGTFSSIVIDGSGVEWDATTNRVKATGTLDVKGGTYDGNGQNTLVSSTLTISGGTFTGGTGKVNLDSNLSQTGGTLNAPSGGFNVAGDWSTTGGSFSANLDTVTLDAQSGGPHSIDLGSASFHNLTIDDGGNGQEFDVSNNTLDVNGDLTLNSGTLDSNSQNIEVEAGWDTSNGTFKEGSQKVVFDGTGGGTPNINESGSFHTLEFNGGSGTEWDATSDFDVDNTLEIKSGSQTFDASGQKIGVTSTVTLNGGTYKAGSSKQTFAGGLTISGGTLKGGSSGDIDIDGTVDLSSGSGSFVAPGATVTVSGTWKNGSDIFDEDTNIPNTVKFDDSNSAGPDYDINESGAFHNLTLAGSETYNIKTNNLTTDNNLTISGGTLDAATNNKDITVKGDWNRTSGDFKEGTQKVTFNNGSTDQKIKSSETFSKLVLDNSGYVVEDTSNNGITAATTTVKSNTTFKPADASTFTGLFTNSGTLQPKSSANVNVQADFDNDGTFNANGGTVTFNGANTQNVNIGGSAFNNVTIDGNTVQIATNTLDIDGNLKIQNSGGSLDANTNNLNVQLAGDWNGDSNDGSDFDEGSGSEKVTFDGSSNKQTIKNGENFNELLIDNTNSSPVVSSTKNITSASTTVKNGTFQPYDDSDFNGDVTINSGATLEALSTTTLTVSGTWKNSGTFTSNSGTTTFDGVSNQKLTAGGSAFNNLFVTSSGSVVPQDKLDVASDLKVTTSSTLDLTNDNNVTTTGDVIIRGDGSVSKGNGLWEFDGSGTNTLEANGDNLGEIKIDGSSKTVQLANTSAQVTTATIKGDDELDLNGQDLTVDNDVVNDNVFKLHGDESVTINGSYDNDSGTTTFDGAVSATIPSSLTSVNHIRFNNGSGTWTLPSKLDTEGDVSIDAGTLDVDSSNDYKINIAGDWDSSGGTFEYRNGTVEFDATGSATQTIKGSEFNNLTKTVSSTQTFELTTSATTTVHNTTTLKGESGNQLKLRSDNAGNKANFAVDKLKQDLDYVDIQDVDASVSNTLYCVNGCTDSGNNSNVVFNVNVSFAKSSDSGGESQSKSFKLELSEPYFVEDVNIDYIDTPVTASDSDYSMDTSTVTIAAGNKSTTTKKLNPVNDSIEENDETIDISISSTSPGYTDLTTTTPDILTYTITKNDQSTSGGSSSGGGGSSFGASGDSTSNVSKTQQGEKEGAVVINGGDEVADKRKVTIEFNVANAEKVALSEDRDFVGVSYADFPSNNKASFMLSEGAGEKTVYAKLRDSEGSSKVESDSIIYSPDGKKVELEPEQPKKEEKVISDELKSGQAYTYPGTNAVYYITQEGTKRPFKNPDVFFTYFDSWGDVEVADRDDLIGVPDDDLGFMPWGPKKEFKSGSMIKTVDDPKVYLIINDKRYWIENGQIFKELGYEWSMITDVDPRVMDKFELGESIDYTDHHPPYSLIKYPDSSKVYRLEPNEDGELEKRHIKNQEVFDQLGYRLDRIITIDKTEQYPTGEPITTQTNDKVPYTFSRYLKRGRQGTEVQNLQKTLKNLGYFEGEVNGYYGLNTVNAVMEFQEANGMERVGVLGPKTRETLNNM
ncbi:MAG: peptidoglycan-binding protein [Candidatus Paceibacteria bacterium]